MAVPRRFHSLLLLLITLAWCLGSSACFSSPTPHPGTGDAYGTDGVLTGTEGDRDNATASPPHSGVDDGCHDGNETQNPDGNETVDDNETATGSASMDSDGGDPAASPFDDDGVTGG